MAGVVLVGGASRRMGEPKALVPIRDVPMARLVADVLLAAGADPVALQGGPPSTGTALGLEVVDDGWPGEGPLAALATAVNWAAGTGATLVVVAACDQPALAEATVRALVAEVVPPARGAVPVSADGRRHPFPAVWHTAAAPALRTLVEGGERRADAAFGLGVVEVATGATELVDLDTPAELEAWRRGDRHGPGGDAP